MRKHHYFIIIACIGMTAWIAITQSEPTELWKPDSWATLSVAVGATMLTLVSIITSILVSNENNRRTEFIEDFTLVFDRLEDKQRTNPDRSLTAIYDNSMRKMRTLTDEMSPLKYSEGLIGMLSFFLFLFSAISAIIGNPFKLTIGYFGIGIILLIGYFIYIIEEFTKIDRLSTLPKKSGELTLLTARLNGENRHFEMRGKEAFVQYNERITRMEFRARFAGYVRNGFLHATVKYADNVVSYVPDVNTYISRFVFADGYHLTIEPDRRLDTGILQSNDPVELSIDVCRDIAENSTIGEVEVSRIGRKPVHRFCSVPENSIVNTVGLRIWEDPLYKANYKRRDIDLITVHLGQSQKA